MSNSKLNRVAIVGGIHGNELTGAYLIKKFNNSPKLVRRETFETLTLLANPKAFEVNQRYIDKDLNRCFLTRDLNNPNLNSYEDLRAKEINEILGDDKVDFIIDLHSTTSNAGIMVILEKEQDPLSLYLAAYLTTINPLVKLFCWDTTQEKNRLRSLSPKSIAIEVGAIPHGTMNPWYFEQTEKLIYTILDFLDSYYKKLTKLTIPSVDVFVGKELLDYPRNHNGELTATIHPDLISQDFQALAPGKPLFLTFDGCTITYQGESTTYPTFIMEQSYLEKGIAMCLCDRVNVPLKDNLNS